MRKYIYAIAISAIFLLFSCRNKVIHEHTVIMNNNTWDWSNLYKTNLHVQDTIKTYNIQLTLNISDSYPYSNLYLFIKTHLPDSNILSDTVNCFLADNSGEWLGKKRFGKIKNKLFYKQNVRFPLSGEYIFEIEQAMRTKQLHGVESCGIIIEEFN